MKVTTKLLKVFDPQGGIGPSGKAWSRTDMKFEGDLKVSTFNGGLASVAKSLEGQAVVVEYDEEQNGQYVNRSLRSIEAVNGAAAPAVATGNTATTHSSGPDQRQTYIHRQSSLKVATDIFVAAGINPLESLEELLQLSDALVGYVEGGIEAGMEKALQSVSVGA